MMEKHTRISLSSLRREFLTIKHKMDNLLHQVGYEYENIASVTNDFDEEFLRSQYIRLLEQFKDISNMIDYLQKPVTNQGILQHNDEGRLAFPNGEYLTSGNVCEIFYTDRDGDAYWVYTVIEHNGETYYPKAFPNLSLTGCMARVRR